MNPKSSGFILFFFIFLLLASSCSGRNLHKGLKENTDIIERQWTRSTILPKEAGERNSEYSNPIITQETLIYATSTGGLTALYPRYNRVRWKLDYKNGISSPLAFDQKHVYFVAGDGFLHAVRIEDGKPEWKTEIKNPIASRATIAGGRLFITSSDDVLYAFDAGTGKWLWHYRRPNISSPTIHGASQPLVDGSMVFSGFSDGSFVAFNVNDGSMIWEKKLNSQGKFTDVDARAVLSNGIIYVPAYDGALYALKRDNGEILWKFDAGGAKQVLIDDDRLYLPSSDSFVYAIQKSSGRELWKFPLDRGVPSILIQEGPYLFFASTFQYLYAIQKSDGKPVSRFNVGWGSGFSGAPAYDPETRMIYWISGAGNLYTFRIK